VPVDGAGDGLPVDGAVDAIDGLPVAIPPPPLVQPATIVATTTSAPTITCARCRATHPDTMSALLDPDRS
jgi:hypothetical protein